MAAERCRFYPVYFAVDTAVPLETAHVVSQLLNETEPDFLLIQSSDLETDVKKGGAGVAAAKDKIPKSATPAATKPSAANNKKGSRDGDGIGRIGEDDAQTLADAAPTISDKTCSDVLRVVDRELQLRQEALNRRLQEERDLAEQLKNPEVKLDAKIAKKSGTTSTAADKKAVKKSDKPAKSTESGAPLSDTLESNAASANPSQPAQLLPLYVWLFDIAKNAADAELLAAQNIPIQAVVRFVSAEEHAVSESIKQQHALFQSTLLNLDRQHVAFDLAANNPSLAHLTSLTSTASSSSLAFDAVNTGGTPSVTSFLTSAFTRAPDGPAPSLTTPLDFLTSPPLQTSKHFRDLAVLPVVNPSLHAPSPPARPGSAAVSSSDNVSLSSEMPTRAGGATATKAGGAKAGSAGGGVPNTPHTTGATSRADKRAPTTSGKASSLSTSDSRARESEAGNSAANSVDVYIRSMVQAMCPALRAFCEQKRRFTAWRSAKNPRITRLPTAKPADQVDMRLYSHLMENSPDTSVHSMLDAMFQQVAATVQHVDITPLLVQQQAASLDSYINSNMQKLASFSAPASSSPSSSSPQPSEEMEKKPPSAPQALGVHLFREGVCVNCNEPEMQLLPTSESAPEGRISHRAYLFESTAEQVAPSTRDTAGLPPLQRHPSIPAAVATLCPATLSAPHTFADISNGNSECTQCGQRRAELEEDPLAELARAPLADIQPVEPQAVESVSTPVRPRIRVSKGDMSTEAQTMLQLSPVVGLCPNTMGRGHTFSQGVCMDCGATDDVESMAPSEAGTSRARSRADSVNMPNDSGEEAATSSRADLAADNDGGTSPVAIASLPAYAKNTTPCRALNAPASDAATAKTDVPIFNYHDRVALAIARAELHAPSGTNNTSSSPTTAGRIKQRLELAAKAAAIKKWLPLPAVTSRRLGMLPLERAAERFAERGIIATELRNRSSLSPAEVEHGLLVLLLEEMLKRPAKSFEHSNVAAHVGVAPANTLPEDVLTEPLESRAVEADVGLFAIDPLSNAKSTLDLEPLTEVHLNAIDRQLQDLEAHFKQTSKRGETRIIYRGAALPVEQLDGTDSAPALPVADPQVLAAATGLNIFSLFSESESACDWRLGERTFREEFSADVLPEVLAAAILDDPTRSTHCQARYNPWDGSLLIACTSDTPLTRKRNSLWNHFRCPSLTFQRWIDASEAVQETPPATMYAFSNEGVETHSGTLGTAQRVYYPADQARMGSISASDGGCAVSALLFLDTDQFVLTVEPVAALAEPDAAVAPLVMQTRFQDDARFTFSVPAETSVNYVDGTEVVYTAASSQLQVRVLGIGAVTMTPPTPLACAPLLTLAAAAGLTSSHRGDDDAFTYGITALSATSPPTFTEKSRALSTEAVVTRTLVSTAGHTVLQMIFPDGSVHTQLPLPPLPPPPPVVPVVPTPAVGTPPVPSTPALGGGNARLSDTSALNKNTSTLRSPPVPTNPNANASTNLNNPNNSTTSGATTTAAHTSAHASASPSPSATAIISSISAPLETIASPTRGADGTDFAKSQALPALVPAPTQWLRVAPGGERAVTDLNGFAVHSLPPLKVIRQRDPSSGAVVLTREDGVMIIHYASGSSMTQHADGTRLHVSSLPHNGGTETVIECTSYPPITQQQRTVAPPSPRPGAVGGSHELAASQSLSSFASEELGVDKFDHTFGVPEVDVELRIALHDGTLLHKRSRRDGDSTIVHRTQANGALRGPAFVCRPSGQCLYIPASFSQQTAAVLESLAPSVLRLETLPREVYLVSLHSPLPAVPASSQLVPPHLGALAFGQLQTRDAEDNVFDLHIRHTLNNPDERLNVPCVKGRSIISRLSGLGGGEGDNEGGDTDFSIPAKYFPPPENPRPPRLFVVRADGTGFELLSAEQLTPFLRVAQADPTATHITQSSPSSSSSLSETSPSSSSNAPTSNSVKFILHEFRQQPYQHRIVLPEVVRASPLGPTAVALAASSSAFLSPQSSISVYRNLTQTAPISAEALAQLREEIVAFREAKATQRAGSTELDTQPDPRSSEEVAVALAVSLEVQQARHKHSRSQARAAELQRQREELQRGRTQLKSVEQQAQAAVNDVIEFGMSKATPVTASQREELRYLKQQRQLEEAKTTASDTLRETNTWSLKQVGPSPPPSSFFTTSRSAPANSNKPKQPIATGPATGRGLDAVRGARSEQVDLASGFFQNPDAAQRWQLEEIMRRMRQVAASSSASPDDSPVANEPTSSRPSSASQSLSLPPLVNSSPSSAALSQLVRGLAWLTQGLEQIVKYPFTPSLRQVDLRCAPYLDAVGSHSAFPQFAPRLLEAFGFRASNPEVDVDAQSVWVLAQSVEFLQRGLSYAAALADDIRAPSRPATAQKESGRTALRPLAYDPDAPGPYALRPKPNDPSSSSSSSSLQQQQSQSEAAQQRGDRIFNALLQQQRGNHQVPRKALSVPMQNAKMGQSFKLSASGKPLPATVVLPTLPTTVATTSSSSSSSSASSSNHGVTTGGNSGGGGNNNVSAWSIAANSAPSDLNTQFINASRDARRPVRTSSTAAAAAHNALAAFPEVIVKPSKLDFGALRCGETRRLQLIILNDSALSARYQLVVPDSRSAQSEGFASVTVRHDSGPIAPGMTRTVEVELVGGAAVASAGVFTDAITVKTEKKIFKVPLVASITV